MRLVTLAALLLFTSSAIADEEYDATKSKDPCADAKEFEQTILEMAEQVKVMIEDMKRTCKHKALAKECARKKLDIESDLQALQNMNAMRKAAQAECKKRSKKEEPAPPPEG